ncbi:MAG: hypothetical protein ACKO3R_03780 [bacterium]
MFGAHNTEAMKRKLKVPKNKPLADFLPTVTLKAKEFAAAIQVQAQNKKLLKGEGSLGDLN